MADLTALRVKSNNNFPAINQSFPCYRHLHLLIDICGGELCVWWLCGVPFLLCICIHYAHFGIWEKKCWTSGTLFWQSPRLGTYGDIHPSCMELALVFVQVKIVIFLCYLIVHTIRTLTNAPASQFQYK